MTISQKWRMSIITPLHRVDDCKQSLLIELRSNTDYRRFDDTLRMLLDCSETQAGEIEVMLTIRAEKGELHYGVHRTDSALMTCLVFNLEKGEHIHFVDGNNGGFTCAAKNLKQNFKH